MSDDLHRAGEPSDPLGYQSEGLAALLEVFTLWGSAEFIATITANIVPALDATTATTLTLIARHGPMRPSALAERLRVGASNVSKITRRLGDAGLLERADDPEDRRAGLLQLTLAGRDVVAKLVDAGDAMMHAIQSEWTSTDREQFSRLLTRFRLDALHYRPTGEGVSA